MDGLTRNGRIVARILLEAQRQGISLGTLARRMGTGWSYRQAALRLGGVPGRMPLTPTEINDFARGLRVSLGQLVDESIGQLVDDQIAV